MIFFNGHESKASLIQRGLRATVEAILFFSRKHLTSTACSMGFFLHLLGRIDHGVQASGVVNGALLIHARRHS